MRFLSCISSFCLLILMELWLSTTSATIYNSKVERIIGGTAIDIRVAPFLVSLRLKKNHTSPFQHRCSGTIYSDSVVLTTATCVIGLESQQLQIVAGTSHRTQSDGYVYLVNKYIIHPDFNIWLMDNDLAIVQLAFNLTKSMPKTIAPIAVATQLPTAGSVASIAGWGATSKNFSQTEYLQLAKVTIFDDDKCKQSYGEYRITKAMICAGSNGDIGAYIGDAGGALVYNRSVVGLVSWGNGYGQNNFLGVYTNLVYLKQWIEIEILKL